MTGRGRAPDPARFTGSDLERASLLNELYAGLERRLRIFVSLSFASLDRLALKRRLDDIDGGREPVTAGGR